MRRTLIAFLNEYEQFEIVGQSANGRELLDLLKEIETDIVLLDLEMPVMGGLEVLRVMQVRFEEVKAVVLSVYNDLRSIRECLSLGARSYISKDCIPEELINSLLNVHLKGFYMEEAIYKSLLQDYTYELANAGRRKLSKRENEILKELYNGRTEKEIALLLNISRGTVHFHRMNIYSKTNTHNIAELLKYVSRNNLV